MQCVISRIGIVSHNGIGPSGNENAAMKGKTIRIYLVDGTPTGVLTAEIINWTGKVIVAPRPRLADLANRSEVRRTGIYCLVGPDPDNPNRERVYVGEGDNVFSRLTSHERDESKDFWTRTVIVISKDENLTKSHGRYLESRLIELAQQAGRAILANGTAPPAPAMPEPDVADMEFFVEHVQMMLPVLGFSFLQPKAIIRSENTEQPSPTFVLKKVGASARAQEVDGEIVVQQGSTARKDGVDSWTSYRTLRDQLVSDGRLVETDDPNLLRFAEDVAFASPSAAAAVVMGRNTNGRIEWRSEEDGITYQQWQDSKLARTPDS